MSTVVLIHALGSSRRAWAAQVRGLSNRHRVLAPDLPGHGDNRAPFTLDRAVDSVHAAIGESPGGVHVVGISVGAVVALRVCLEHPADVASLVLSGGLAHPQIVSGATHLWNLQLPDTFNRTTAAFLQRAAS